MWRSSDWVERGIFIVLALMLAYTVFVVIRFSRCYYLPRRESGLVRDSWRACQRSQKTLVADLSRGLRTLKAITSAAPFLGLSGTSYGILAALWFNYSGSPGRFVVIVAARIASAFTATLAGILVAVPAAIFYNFLHARIDQFRFELASTVPTAMSPDEDHASPRPFRGAQTLPLKNRFSSMPPFALLAAPAIASVVALLMPFHPYRIPTGFSVQPVSDRCEFEGDDRMIVLHIDEAGNLFINNYPEDRKNLETVLSAIYDHRQQRTLYLLADDRAPFQTVADAIDIVKNTPVSAKGSPEITVRLITPQSENADCLAPVQARPERHNSR